MWRRLRRHIGYWIAGDKRDEVDPPRVVHCGYCGHITSAFCVGCRDRILASLDTSEMPNLSPRRRP